MRTTLILPVVDTERGKFEYTGRTFSNEEYGEMEYRKFVNTNGRVSRFVYNMARGVYNVNPYGDRLHDVDTTQYPDIIFNNEDVDAIFLNGSRNDMSEAELVQHVRRGDMFVMILNIVSDTLTGDGESELRYWLEDCIKVVNDNSLPDEVKLKSLQGRDYGVALSDGNVVTIKNCKMVQDFSNKRYPFYFAIIVEKAIM